MSHGITYNVIVIVVVVIIIIIIILGVIHIWRLFWRGWVGWGKNEMLPDVEGWWVSKCYGRPILFFIKKVGFWPWPDIMLIIYYWQEIFLLTLTSDSQAILQWYHCIVCGLNRTIERVVNLNVMWLCFCFVSVLLCSFLYTVRLLFYRLFMFSRCANKTGWLQNESENVNNYK